MATYFMGLLSVTIGCVLMIPRFIMRGKKDGKPLIQVVVLGDVGHSPRMQYHTLSLAESGRVRVELIGYKGSKPIEKLSSHQDVRIRYLMRFRLSDKLHVPFFVYGLLKAIFDSLVLLTTLLFASGSIADVIMIQTPPAVPTMLVCVLVRFITGAKLIFDFHNITYMHLGSKLTTSTSSRIIVELVKLYETLLSKFAHHSLCVTVSMKSFLEAEYSLNNVTTLYDKPGPQFVGKVMDSRVRAELEDRFIREGFIKEKLTNYNHLIVSSTSWTKDEDFSLVLDALPKWSKSLLEKKQRALLFITGKGEMKEDFESKFKSLKLPNIDLGTGWIAASDYPLILGCADAGISVHTSTSGLDLPMKAVDMLGSDCPVIAYKFPALTELLKEGEGGMTFVNASELGDHLIAITTGSEAELLRKKFQIFASNWRKRDWKIEWNDKVWPIVDSMLASRSSNGGIKKQSRQARRRND